MATSRLPVPGSDDGAWGDILNDYLQVAHDSDGTLKAIPESKVTGLSADLALKANAADLKPVAITGSYADLINKPALPVTIAETAPTPMADQAWWDVAGGNMYRYDAAYLSEWVPLGEPAPMNGYHSVGLGRANLNSNASAVAIGDAASTTGTNSVAIGSNAAAGINSVVIGNGAHSANNSTNTVAIGAGVAADVTSAVAIGNYPVVHSVNSIAIGNNASAGDPTGSGAPSLSIGSAVAANAINSVVLGFDASTISGVSGGVAIGNGATTTDHDGTAIGSYGSRAGAGALALGVSAQADGADSIAIGTVTVATAGAAAMATHELELIPSYSAQSSVILRSPDGTRWRLSIANGGTLSITSL